ncbi:hypothetical protein [Haliangium sp.]|uniref:carboxypeptidase-like regulatory domain-containing protein n=1 Tax=Haliangium sp. TaxID=2663208 RepID=UPI003D10999C
MKRTTRYVLAAWAVAGGMSGCGDGGGGGGPVPPDAGSPPSDGGPVQSCTLSIGFDQTMWQAPGDVVAQALVASEAVSGVQRYQWQVTFDGALVGIRPFDQDGTAIAFTAETPGPYEVRLAGSVGGVVCADAVEAVNVSPPDADAVTYRIRFVPAPGHGFAAQEQLVTLPAGVDYALGTLTLGTGQPVTGVVIDRNNAAVAAYLRVSPAGAPEAGFVETFTDDDGDFSLRLPGGRHDVLVVPASPAYAPARLGNLSTDELAALVVPPAATVAGVVQDPDGLALASARVSLHPEGTPPAVITTGADGDFAAPVRVGPALALTVIPPEQSGLPWLALAPSTELGAALAADQDPPTLAIGYDPGLAAREVVAMAVGPDGQTPVAGVSATWIARPDVAPMTQAATVRVGAGDPVLVPGSARLAVTAGADGAWPALRLPAALYDVVLEPAGGTAGAQVTVREVDLRTGADTPSTLALAAPAHLRGVVVDELGAAVPGVRVSATPIELLVASTAAGAVARTTADGGFDLAVAGAGSYRLRVAPGTGPAGGTTAGASVDAVAPGPGASLDLGSIALPAAVQLSGQVSVPGLPGGVPGVTVQLVCAAGPCPDDVEPVAEAVTGAGGGFVLAVPSAPAPEP